MNANTSPASTREVLHKVAALLRAEVIARRITLDGIAVQIWSDGALTDRLGRNTIRGRIPVALAFVVADEICLYGWAELPRLIAAAKRTAKAKQPHGALHAFRQEIAGYALAKPGSTPCLGVGAGIARETREHIAICRAFHCKRCGS